MEQERRIEKGKLRRKLKTVWKCEAKAQHPQTYGCLLDYTSAGWKITSSVCAYMCALYLCVLLHMLERVRVQDLTLNPAKDYSIPVNFCV